MNINKVLENYIPTAHLIAETFGNNCEIVLHDFTTPSYSVVYTINNHVTGREVGQSFNHMISDVLLSKNFNNDYVSNYTNHSIEGKIIKSSTALIRDNRDKIIGTLCVNFDISNFLKYQSDLDNIFYIEETILEEQPLENVIEITYSLIDKIIDNVNINKLNRREKIDIIKFMNEKDIFLVKGAIDKVAEKLNISKVTVYSYLDEIKNNK